ncbi:TPA: DUF551 domain-containing protein [Klebsiella pneumoniae]|nr:DUF551 domain-containing protein [Klebsiella pneumoniae]
MTSKLTRERLEKIKSWRETYGAGSNVMLPAEEAEELARIALAAMAGEPFAYIIQDKYERERGVEGHLSRSHVSKYVSQEDINEHEITCTPLYRHAQQPVVPDDLSIFEAAIEECKTCDSIDEHAWNHGVLAVIAKYESCRAAMLQAGNSPVIQDGSADMLGRWLSFGRGMQSAGSQLPHNLIAETESMLAAAPQSPGSEPATVPGKWIPVSERMPETDGNYWGWWSESKRQGPVWFIKSELQAQFQSSEITHWMPLPAAPQEVKGE